MFTTTTIKTGLFGREEKIFYNQSQTSLKKVLTHKKLAFGREKENTLKVTKVETKLSTYYSFIVRQETFQKLCLETKKVCKRKEKKIIISH